MAIIRNAANTLMKGRVGQTTYYISKGQQVARQSRNDSNYGETARRTILQQNRRVLWANLVNFYKISARWMPKAFESKRSGQTDYNKFMAVNVPSARIPLTKSESEAGACVVDNFLISQGSLPSIETTQVGQAWKTNIFTGNLAIAAGTTIAEFTTAVLAANANLREGMQLSFVMYSQSIDPLGTPRVNCRCYELTLSTTSMDLVRDHIPAIGSSVVDGALGTSSDISEGGFAWILSELQGGSLKVSTQLLINNNSSVMDPYLTTQRLKAAAQSYGIDTEVILNPDTTVAQELEPSTISILAMYIGNTAYYANSYVGAIGQLHEADVAVNFSNRGSQQVTAARVQRTDPQGSSFAWTPATLGEWENTALHMTFPTIQGNEQNLISALEVTFDDQTVATIPFSLTNSGSGDMG